MRTFARYALSNGAAAALLAACGGSQPLIGASGAMAQSRAVATRSERGAAPSYLYVADASTQQPAIVAFDVAGNKVAEKRFKSDGGGPVDVVTDSRGHVYAIVYDKARNSPVIEYTHNLDRQIAEYHPPGYSTTMTIDAADNLYVESDTGSENIVRYRYGSTRVDHTYSIVSGPPDEMLGISVRGNTLYTLIAYVNSNPPDLLIQCDIKGAKPCNYYNGPTNLLCGFTTANQDYVYAPQVTDADEIRYVTIGGSFEKNGHDMRLPAGYGFNTGNCIFHSYGDDVWVTLQGDSQPAAAAEIDLHRKVVKRMIGGGYLDNPQAAYYGNGFTP